jgi:hypothetical protein
LDSQIGIDCIERSRKNAENARIPQAVRGKAICVHLCYHIRNISRSRHVEAKSIRNQVDS